MLHRRIGEGHHHDAALEEGDDVAATKGTGREALKRKLRALCLMSTTSSLSRTIASAELADVVRTRAPHFAVRHEARQLATGGEGGYAAGVEARDRGERTDDLPARTRCA